MTSIYSAMLTVLVTLQVLLWDELSVWKAKVSLSPFRSSPKILFTVSTLYFVSKVPLYLETTAQAIAWPCMKWNLVNILLCYLYTVHT